jgi:hypothetical protein
MKKAMLFIVSMLFAVSVNAATLSLSTAGSSAGTSQSVSGVLNNGDLAVGSGETSGGQWYSLFDLTTDVDTMAKIEWSFNPESAVDEATLAIGSEEDFGYLALFNVAGDFVTTFFLEAGKTYWIDFASVVSTALSYDLSVAAVPVPAALWLFGPALLGLFGLRRKAVVAA